MTGEGVAMGRRNQRMLWVWGVVLVGLICRQNQKFTGLFKRLEGKITGVESRLEGKITGVEQCMRNNGILLEKLDDYVREIGANVSDFSNKMTKVTADIEEIKENIIDLPLIRKMLQKHERQLAKSG